MPHKQSSDAITTMTRPRASATAAVEPASSLPAWERDGGDIPDPLHGKLGWAFRDYVNIAVAACLITTIVGLLLPLVMPVREADARTRNLNKAREFQLDMRADPGMVQ